jgi:hypothetical protein
MKKTEAKKSRATVPLIQGEPFYPGLTCHGSQLKSLSIKNQYGKIALILVIIYA